MIYYQYIKSCCQILIVFGISLIASSCTGTDITHTEESKMFTPSKLNINFWKMLSTIEAQIPFTQQKIENLFKVSLADTSKNTYFYDFKGGPALLNDGAVIDNIIFFIKQDGTEPGDVSIEISGPCISLKEVQSHYKNTRITYLPRPEEGHKARVGYSDFRPWGALSFAFNFDMYGGKGIGCLTGVGFQASYISDIISTIETIILRAKQKIEQGKWVDANLDIVNGLDGAGSDSPYASPDVLAKSKKQLELADQSGQLEKIVPLRLEVLQMRLADFKARYQKPNPR